MQIDPLPRAALIKSIWPSFYYSMSFPRILILWYQRLSKFKVCRNLARFEADLHQYCHIVIFLGVLLTCTLMVLSPVCGYWRVLISSYMALLSLIGNKISLCQRFSSLNIYTAPFCFFIFHFFLIFSTSIPNFKTSRLSTE